jgi:diguanylate cyclase (GGDEF)-like protein/PAS domain S-box-containing protein
MTSAAACPGAVVRPAPPTILVVEDESALALDLELLLNRMNYEVCGVADNGRDAIARAWKQRPNLVLMDTGIKGDIDGMEAVSQISGTLHIPVIFITPGSDDQTVERAAASASYGYLTKPFDARQLHAAIEVALYKAALERQLRESEQWFAATLRCVGDAVVATDVQGSVQFMNPSAEELVGRRLDEVLGHDVSEVLTLLDPHTGFPLESPSRRALAESSVIGIEFGSTLIARGGERVPIDDSAAPIRDQEGKPLGVVIVFRDVRARLAAEDKLKQSEERFRSAFDFAPVGMALISLDNRFLQVNAAIRALLGRSEGELVGADQALFSLGTDLANEGSLLYQLISGQSTSVQFEKRYRNKRGQSIYSLVSVSLLRQKAEPLCYLWQVHDLTERKNAEFRLAHLAHFDPLTGLANRAWLGEEVARQIILARRHQTRFAVVILDLDHFKQVNDSLGHDAGDEMLQLIATKLRGSVRETDSVARLGGDEFVMLLPEIHTADDVLVVTGKVQAECAKPAAISGHEISVGISLGVSLFPDDATDFRTLLRYADSALYQAKADGRDNLQFYRPELTARVEQKMRLGVGLRLAIERHEFTLFYQPIVSLANRMPLAVEALIRWNHPTLGLLSPDTFIPIAEETGLSVPIGEWVIHQACREAATWAGDGQSDLIVATNVSARQFKAGNLVRIVKQALAASGLDPARLCIEITEKLLLEDSEQNLATIAELKALGVHFAIDDFGIGYSSLSYIGRFAPSELKIDTSLVRNVALNQTDAAIVRAAIAMAHSLQMHVVTEGVETQAQEAFLQREHCDMAQGFFYLHPHPAAEFREWLKNSAAQQA